MLASIKEKILALALAATIFFGVIWAEIRKRTAIKNERAKREAEDNKAALDRWKRSVEATNNSRNDTRPVDERLRDHGRLRD